MRRDQLLIVSFYILFAVSTAIVLIASMASGPVPAWGGYIDVGIVVVLAGIGILIHQRNKSAPRHEVAHTVAVYLFLSILPHAITLWNVEIQP